MERGDRDAVPAALAARYRFGPVLGRGSIATVHLADDSRLGRRVAIKVYAARSDDKRVRVEHEEARLVASLNHPALTTLYDAGVDVSDPQRPQVYLVMEYVEGADLKERLRDGPLPVPQVLALGRDLADGLDAMHGSGVLHRDIKPANVLLADPSPGSRIRGKLTDFGLASLLDGGDYADYIVGTPAYISPEQAEGDAVGRPSDVYSLGLVLLEALTGAEAFPGPAQVSAYARLDRDPEVPDALPVGVAELLRAMTLRTPEDRPSAGDAAGRFHDLVLDELVRRRAPGSPTSRDDEAERLAALRRYDILDTPPEVAFDQVTRLASRLLNVPIALVTIIDTDRVWFKSRRGWDGQEVDRGIAFCSTTNPGGDGPWSIPDATTDPRTSANPLVLHGPQVRSYAAAPLITWDGHHLGALCVFDRRTRDFDDEELGDLTDLAGIVMRELELRLASRRAVFDRR
ncbi:MAG TPA: GAF domain-containing serine/threonine-protein kinase [Amnibacterium sp.]|jgi:serine/threonine protein kinase